MPDTVIAWCLSTLWIIYRLCHCILHQVAHIDCSAPSGKQHEPLTGVWVIAQGLSYHGLHTVPRNSTPKVYLIHQVAQFTTATITGTTTTIATSTVYWCIASKLKAPRNLYWMSSMFLWVEIFIFFVCYHVVPKRHSQLDYELNGL